MGAKKHKKSHTPAQMLQTKWAARLFAGGYSLLAFTVAVSISWVLLAPVNFGYPLWHDVGGIGDGIERYGPENRFKQGFADTTREQRIALFAAINASVHSSGDGLAEISYETASSEGQQKLLREPEVIHLQDVANLIDHLRMFSLLALLLWLGVTGLLWKRRKFPGFSMQIKGLMALLVPACVVVFVVGPENAFNGLHEIIFPEGHQWFFYYQESLMSTLMLAPVLFAWIAVALLLVSLLVFFAMQYGLVLAVRASHDRLST